METGRTEPIEMIARPEMREERVSDEGERNERNGTDVTLERLSVDLSLEYI